MIHIVGACVLMWVGLTLLLANWKPTFFNVILTGGGVIVFVHWFRVLDAGLFWFVVGATMMALAIAWVRTERDGTVPDPGDIFVFGIGLYIALIHLSAVHT